MDTMDFADSASVKDMLPEEYHDVISSSYIFLDGELSTNIPALDCVICTKQGRLLEFSKLAVVNSCNIASNNAEKLIPIHTYYKHRDDIHYIVQYPGKRLEIISRFPTFKSVILENNVIEWTVDDTLGFGYPQLRVKRRNDKWQNVNFKEDDQQQIYSEGAKKMLIPLTRKIKEMKLELDDCDDLLNEKRQWRMQISEGLLRISSSADPSLAVQSCKPVFHHGKAILVVTLKHIGRSAVSNIQLLVVNNKWARLEQWGAPALLQDGKEICVVGAISTKESFIASSTATAVSYTCEGKEHIVPLAPSNTMPADILHRDKLRLETLGTHELCTVLKHCSGISQHWQIQCSQVDLPTMWKLLIEKISKVESLLRETKENKIICFTGEVYELCGSYLNLKPHRNSIVASCRDHLQLSLLQNILSGILPDKCKLLPIEEGSMKLDGNQKSGLEALENELDWLSQHSKLLLKPVPMESYKVFFDELTKRSIATDSFFTSRDLQE